MLKINKFLMKDVRCFRSTKEFNIRPLTFLVGENSTGKSTVLGCFQTIINYLTKKVDAVDFNSDSFQMGSFENIARRAKPKNKEFELGFEFIDNRNDISKFELLVTFSEQANSANPIIKKIHFVFDDGEIIILNADTSKNNETSKIRIERQNSKKIFTIFLEKYQHRSFLYEVMSEIYEYTHYYVYRQFGEEELNSEVREEGEKLSSEEKQLIEFFKDKDVDRLLRFHFRCFPFAPTRSEPRRTYEPLYDIATSFGDEIPVRLRDLSSEKSEVWDKLYESLKDFGKKSGLFTDIKVRKLGGSLSNPFQLEFKIRKSAATNLIDVGYGVSQILPLLVRILTHKKNISLERIAPLKHIFLMQQPEVHLHPKAQAAFTSLLATSAKEKNNTFIIETHSDYMVNRARIDIMKGNIKPEHVSLIYLEAKGKDVEVHNLCFDKQGNFKDDPPNNYRDFFLTETHRLLGWED